MNSGSSRAPRTAWFLPRCLLPWLLSLALFPARGSLPTPPTLVTEPRGVALQLGEKLNLRVEASGSQPLTYQWWHNARPIPDATNAVYTVDAVARGDAGGYAVGVTNKYGFANSSDVQVTVLSPPLITEQPQPRTVESGDYFWLSATAIGTEPIRFYWFRDGSPISGGSSNNTLIVDVSDQSRDSGLYQVVVSNRWGSVTSEPARITVTSAPPNPEYLDRRFVALARTGMPVAGSATALGSVAAHLGARWSGREVHFAGLSAAHQPLGLLRAGLQGVSLEVPIGLSLSNGLGVAQGYGLPGGATAADPLLVLASTNLASAPYFQGVYRWEGTALLPLVDLRTPVPEADGETFVGFSEVVQHGDRFALLGHTGRRWGVYVWAEGTLRRLLDTTQELPIVGPQANGLYGLGWDGSVAAVNVAADPVGFVATLRLGGDGQVRAILEVADRIPETDRPIRDLLRLVVDDGVVYGATARSPDGSESIIIWRDGTVRGRFNPGTVVDAWGAVSTFHGESFLVSGGQLYAAAGSVPGYYAIRTDADGHHRMFVRRKLDGRIVQGTYPLCVDAGRVALRVPFAANDEAIYANVPIVLHAERPTAGQLHMRIPDGHSLESGPTPAGPWQTVEAVGTLQVPTTTAPNGFYRLRER